MNYKVKLTTNAIEQIQAVVDYIADVLLEPETAERWKNRIKSDISQLSYMPGRIRLTDEEPWHSLGIHRMSIRNFYVYFWINEEELTVWITAVVYERRDQLPILIDMPLE